MKKGELRLFIFEFIIIFLLILNSFISSILNYQNILLLLIGMMIVTKYLFGFEKANNRYDKEIIINLLIVILTCFIIYYLSGLIIGFVKTDTLTSIYGLTNFIIPFTVSLVLKEILRYNLLRKGEKSKFLLVLTIILFIMLDVTFTLANGFTGSKYSKFLFFALTFLPSVSRNVTATYIAKKISFIPNILWLLIVNLYSSIIPIMPSTGNYVGSLLKLLFPVVIFYSVFTFVQNRKMNKPLRDNNEHRLLGISLTGIFVAVVVYFSSGFFKYYAIAVATGSMVPNISIGDVVIVNQKYDLNDIKVSDIIAVKYDNKIIVHRIVKIVNNNDELYIYTKGDANKSLDNYIVNKDMIIGVVNIKIPYIGLPTVWLNDL